MLILILALALIVFFAYTYKAKKDGSNGEIFHIYTSNKEKAAEYERFGLNIVVHDNVDLKEVKGSPLEVILHKAKAMKKGDIVEDTSLEVEGEDIGAMIKHQINEVLTNEKYIGKPTTWRVLLGYNDGESIKVYEGVAKGVIVKKTGDGFGFDPVFRPDGSEFSLAELNNKGEKDAFSARRLAVDKLLKNDGTSHKIIEIAEWTGEYQ